MSLYAIVDKDDNLLMIGTHMEGTFVQIAAIFNAEEAAAYLLETMQKKSPAMKKCRVADVSTLSRVGIKDEGGKEAHPKGEET